MANRRMISSGLFEDEWSGTLDFFDQVLWIGLICAVADDQGRLLDSAAVIRAKVFLYKTDSITDKQVDSALCRFSDAGKIARYVAGNKRLIQIVKWWIYQTPTWVSPSKYPPPEKWMDRERYHGAENAIITRNWDKVGGYVEDYVVVLDSALNERKGNDVKAEMKGNEGEANARFSEFQRWVEQATGYPTQPSDVQAINELIAIDATEDDVKAAVAFFSSKGKTARGAEQLKASIITAKGIRVQKKVKSPYQPAAPEWNPL